MLIFGRKFIDFINTNVSRSLYAIKLDLLSSLDKLRVRVVPSSPGIGWPLMDARTRCNQQQEHVSHTSQMRIASHLILTVLGKAQLPNLSSSSVPVILQKKGRNP